MESTPGSGPAPGRQSRRSLLRGGALGLAAGASAGGVLWPASAHAAPGPLQAKAFVTVGRDRGDDFRADGTNDADQIQAAINQVAGDGGGVVFIRTGEYRIDKTITFPFDAKVRLLGESMTKTATDTRGGSALLATADLDAMFVAAGRSNPVDNNDLTHGAHFEYLTLDGDDRTANLIKLVNQDHTVVNHCRLRKGTTSIRTVWDGEDNPIAATVPGALWVLNSIVSARNGYGIDMQFQTQCWISNCWFSGGGDIPGAETTWINLAGCNKIKIDSCEFNTAKVVLAFRDGIPDPSKPDTMYPTHNIVVSNCNFVNGRSNAAWIDERTHPQSRNISITGSTFDAGLAMDPLVGPGNILANGNGADIPGVQKKTFITVGPTDADYITDGDADDVQINAAIQEVGDAGGGVVYIKAGEYHITNTIENNRAGVLLKGELATHYPKVSYLKAGTGGFSPLVRLSVPQESEIAHARPGGFEDLYLDGEHAPNQWIEDGIVIGDPTPPHPDANIALRKLKGPRFRNLRIEHFTGHGITGIVNEHYTSGSFDDVTFDDIRIAWCGVGFRNTSTATRFNGGVFGACNTGYVAEAAAGCEFFATVWSTVPGDGRWLQNPNALPLEPWFCAVDIQTDKSVSSHTFNGCYFESPTHSILRRTVPGVNSNTGAPFPWTGGFTFIGCSMRNLSGGGHPDFDDVEDFEFAHNGLMMDLEHIGGTVALINCWYDTQVLAGKERASRRVHVGDDAQVVVVGADNFGDTSSRELEFEGNTAGVSNYRGGFTGINTSYLPRKRTTTPINPPVASRLTVNDPVAVDERAVAIISPGAGNEKPLVIQATQGQQARLTEWQNTAGVAVAFVSNLGRIYAFAGTEALPGIGNAADTDTGMYFPAADTVGWTVGGTLAMRLDSSELAMQGHRISDLAEPEDEHDAATKSYVDTAIQALRQELGR